MDAVQRFRIDGVLGEGGMGIVYRAFDPELERAVAIKVLAAPAARLEALDEHRTVDLRDEQRTGGELLAEARVMAAISHPNVLPIFEVGRAGDKLFLVMELVDGMNLRRWLAAAPRAVPDILAVLDGGARGLAAAHARGIVHGDFKPDNLLVAGDGRVLVGDFGVSSFVAGPRASLVRVDDTRGTPAYMAPETWLGERADPAADVYAFAMTAAEALLGERPSPPETAEQATAIDRALAARDVPARVRDTIVRGLDPEPRARPVDLVAALSPAPRRRRWITPAIGGGVVVAAGAAIAIIVATRGAAAPTCATGSAPAVWTPARAAEMRALSIPEAARIAGVLDERFEAQAAVRQGACQRRASGDLGRAQQIAIEGCLERTIAELDVRIGVSLAAPDRAAALLFATPPSFEDCRTRVDPPIDPTKHRELVGKFIAAATLPRDDWRREIAALAPAAVALGDHELAARMMSGHAASLAGQRDLVGAHAAFDKARALAQEAGSLVTELRVVAEHIDVARYHDELPRASLLVSDAKALIARVPPNTAVLEKAYTYIAMVMTQRGEYREARDFDRRAIAAMEAAGKGATKAAVDRRLEILQVTAKIDEPLPADYKAFVEETHRLVDAVYPDHAGSAYRAALFSIVDGYRTLEDPRGDELWEAALDVIRAEKPEPGNSPIAHQGILAGELFLRDRQDEAIEIMQRVVRESARASTVDVAAANRREEHLMVLALMLFATNQADAAHPVAEDALLEITGKVGAVHARTKDALEVLISIELMQRDADQAEKHVEALDRAVRAAPAPADEAKVAIRRAGVARVRGELEAAEKIARQALMTVAEIDAKPALVQDANLELGRILVAQHREAEALPFLLDGLPAPGKRNYFDCIAEFEIARVERIAGKRDDGDARARRCLATTKHLRGFAAERAVVETWLAAP